MSQKTMNSNTIILAGIASFTIIVVAVVWFLSSANTRANGSSSTVQRTNSMTGGNDMSGHHSGGGGNASTAALEALVGKQAPDFSIADLDGKTYSKENLKGKKVVLFFNEGLMCYPACWEQIAQLGLDNRFKNNDIVALSVVVDSAKDWKRAIEKMPELAKATVIFDTSRRVSSQFGVLTTPSSMHYGSLPGHSYVVIDKEGIVRHVYDDPNMAIHNEQLIEELKKI